MRDKELYARIVGIEAPWRVEDVELNLQQGEVVVRVAHDGGPLRCPECGRPANRYDTRQRRWRHLDTCQYRTILAAEVPRVQCEHHKVKQIEVPWSESRSRFTALFEAVVIDWLQEASTAAVAQQLGLSWDEVDGVMQRAVQRGLQRREVQLPARLGVDETSFQKRHEYVTVINDLDGKVVYVADGRTKESLEKFYKQFDSEQLAQVHTVAMDMWEPYISVTTQYVPDAENKIAFDKFHIAGHLGDAVDQVRRAEHRRLLGEDDERLKGSRYKWLTNPEHGSRALGIRRAARQRPEDRPCVGLQGTCGRCGTTRADLGAQGMAGVVRLGDPLSGAGEASGAHDQAPPGRHRDRRQGYPLAESQPALDARHLLSPGPRGVDR